jgi:hypothetical protein
LFGAAAWGVRCSDNAAEDQQQVYESGMGEFHKKTSYWQSIAGRSSWQVYGNPWQSFEHAGLIITVARYSSTFEIAMSCPCHL